MIMVLAGLAALGYMGTKGTPTPTPAQSGGRFAGGAPPVVKTALAETRDVTLRRTAIGFVEPEASVTLRARIDSQIVEQHVEDGQFVKKGDLLFTLDDRDLQAQLAKDRATLARDQAAVIRTSGDLTRTEQLLQRNTASQQQFDQASADAKSAAAVVEADKAVIDADQLKLGYAKITAPIDGRIGAVSVAPGNLVNAAGPTIATITQMQPVRVSFALPERDLDTVKALIGQKKEARVKARPAAATDTQAIEGTLTFLDSVVDASSGTMSLKASFPNENLGLWPGQYVKVELETGVITAGTVVPTPAVQQGQNGAYVFVVKPDSTIDLRAVSVTLTDGGVSIVGQGVQPGEKVVVEGQQRLKAGMTVREPQADGTVGGQRQGNGAQQGAGQRQGGQRPAGAAQPVVQGGQP